MRYKPDMSGKAVVIHSLPHACAAAAAAAELGVPVVLISAPDASAYLGARWFRRVVERARAQAPMIAVEGLLDCDARPGDVLAALRAGVTGVIFTGRSDVAAKLEALAAAHGAKLHRARPAACDLLDADDPVATCRAWLAER